jgi:hypothetical protein
MNATNQQFSGLLADAFLDHPEFVAPAKYAHLPEKMQSEKNFLVWRKKPRTDTDKFDKVPYNPRTGKPANSPELGVSLAEACAAEVSSGYDGIGFYVEYPYMVSDLDACVNAETGEIDSKALEIASTLNTFVELSVSGTGLHFWMLGKKPGNACRRGNLEIYDTKRFIAIGSRLDGSPRTIEDRTKELAVVYGRMLAGDSKEAVEPSASTSMTNELGKIQSDDSQIHHAGKAITNLITLLSTGDYAPDSIPFRVTDEFENWVEYRSQSEAVASLLVCLAAKHDCDSEKMEQEYLDSHLSDIPKWANGKWDRLKNDEIKSAIAKIKKTVTSTAVAVNQSAPAEEDLEEKVWPDPRFAMSQEELDAQDADDVEHPIWKLRESAGPNFDDALLYGPLGEVTRRLCEFSEANTGAVYLNLLVSFGNMIGRLAYFNAGSTRHYLNEFLACVGPSSIGRKGTASDVADSFLHLINARWLATNNVSGFSTPQAVIAQIKDASVFKKFDKKTGYSDVEQPGVADKRLCIREGELSNVFKLMSDPKTKAAELIRNLWDGKAVSNVVAGKSADGENNSLMCKEPHVSIVGSSTPSLVKSTMPIGAALSGDGNRFLWCYVKRTQLSPSGGPVIDFSKLSTSFVDNKGKTQGVSTFVYFTDILQEFGALDVDADAEAKFYPLTKAANKHWNKVYCNQETVENAGFLGGMTSRSAPHIRRLATILCIIDRECSVDIKHLKAAERLWDYTQRCAQHIFKGYSVEQYRILMLAKEKGSAGIRMIDAHNLFGRNKPAEWIRAQIKGLVAEDFLTASSDGTRNPIYHFKRE